MYTALMDNELTGQDIAVAQALLGQWSNEMRVIR
jgi:hypothetical protein